MGWWWLYGLPRKQKQWTQKKVQWDRHHAGNGLINVRNAEQFQNLETTRICVMVSTTTALKKNVKKSNIHQEAFQHLLNQLKNAKPVAANNT